MNKNTTMKKTIKLMATALICATLCGTATAAPRGNGERNNDHGRNNAPQHQRAEAPRQNNHDNGRHAPQKAYREDNDKGVKNAQPPSCRKPRPGKDLIRRAT
jgi:hypothetical protein